MRTGLIAVCVLGVMAWIVSGPMTVSFAGAGAGPPPAAFLYTAAKQYDPTVWMRGGERFASGATVYLVNGDKRRALVSGFAATADPSVSFDAQNVLFAGKRTVNSPWLIWEVSLEDGQVRSVTSGSEDCVRPFYLPEDRVVYARKVKGRFVIEIAPLNGKAPLQLTYAPGNFLPTGVLRDGRVLFETAYPLGGNVSAELYTVYSDGSGVESYRCDHGRSRYAGRQVASGDIVFARERGLSRFTSALAKEVEVAAPVGEYAGDIAENSAGDWLLAWRAGAQKLFELKSWTPGASSFKTIAKMDGVNVVQPVLLEVRPVPNRHPSGLHDWNNANLLCLNAYTSKFNFQSGSIKTARLYTRSATGRAELLGSTSVERDGSFYVQVPNDKPLRIELLDASGKTLKREAGWFWMRRGEQRICVGCHAGPETAPENAVPMVLQRSTKPADMTGAAAHASTGGH